ncbi:alpha/beta fold hydrolase [Microbacterium sp. P06]|uniref:alpha/beta fold hydrolase n=1 Tax=Microbacterium sp. P06 TaxID=3366949 RepID=UPI0037476F9C
MSDDDSTDQIEVTVDHVHTDGAVTRVTRMTTSTGRDTRAFVLVAGIGVAATYFEFLAPLLARKGAVYALDLPGFAGVRRPHVAPTAAFFADQVEAVLDHFALNDPVLIGHSMGTQVVTEVLLRRPALRHGVLVSPVVNEAESAPLVQGVRFAQSASRESFHLAMTALSAYILCGVVYFLTVLPHMLRYRITDRIRHVQTKTLLIRGEYDRSSPRRFHTRLAEALPDPWRWEMKGAAHSIINGHAVGVAKLVLRHLDDDLPRRGQMSSEEAEVPPARHADLRMFLGALASRAAEWVSALRGDERGVARAKAEHARLLWRAYSPRER